MLVEANPLRRGLCDAAALSSWNIITMNVTIKERQIFYSANNMFHRLSFTAGDHPLDFAAIDIPAATGLHVMEDLVSGFVGSGLGSYVLGNVSREFSGIAAAPCLLAAATDSEKIVFVRSATFIFRQRIEGKLGTRLDAFAAVATGQAIADEDLKPDLFFNSFQ
jgi:hypothetical protein